MRDSQKLFGSLRRAVIFMSGSGTNAECILRHLATLKPQPIEIAAIVTDAPKTSRAYEIGRVFNLPVVACDIREYYNRYGETRVSIATPRGQEIRQLWTDELRRLIAPCKPDFGIFAGFVPLTNLAADFPCLNIHPGDLTYRDRDNRRLLVGLHTIPIERAILSGLSYLRSSVIQVEPYTGSGGEMDSGLILGISGKVPIDLQGASLDQLKAECEARPAQRPKGGYGDTLERIAKANQENLKIHGDWVVFPRVVCSLDKYYSADSQPPAAAVDTTLPWNGTKVTTVIYEEGGTETPAYLVREPNGDYVLRENHI